MVHGDDFVAVGPESGLAAFEQVLKANYEYKVQVLGPDPGQVR